MKLMHWQPSKAMCIYVEFITWQIVWSCGLFVCPWYVHLFVRENGFTLSIYTT